MLRSKTEEQDTIHYLGVLIIFIKSVLSGCLYESHAQLAGLSVWSVSAFQENISRSKRNQSCSDRGGGVWVNGGIPPKGNGLSPSCTARRGKGAGRVVWRLTVVFWCICKHFFSELLTFLSSKLEQALTDVKTTFLCAYIQSLCMASSLIKGGNTRLEGKCKKKGCRIHSFILWACA